MVNVIVASEVLNEGECFFNPREFPESPKFGDYINILSFVKGEIKDELEKYFKSKNKISIGRVDGRSWGYDEDKLSLFVTLDFEDLDDGDNFDAALHFPG